MTPIGYIVQYSNEDDYTVYHGFMRLHRHFSAALESAIEQYRSYLQSHEEVVGHFQTKTPTKKQCDEQGSVIVFESREYIVWIDCVVE
jgi:hypothetical protein